MTRPAVTFATVTGVAICLTSASCISSRASLCWTREEKSWTYLSTAPPDNREMLTLVAPEAQEGHGVQDLWFTDGNKHIFLCRVPNSCSSTACIAERYEFRQTPGGWTLGDSGEVVKVEAD
jgi:hypothetical protein